MLPALRALPTTEDDQTRAVADAALAHTISSWLRTELEGDEGLVERMTEMAMSVHAEGATADETCAWTRSLVRSWLRHPSNGPSRRHLRLVTA